MLKDNSLISLPSLLSDSAVFENMVEVDYAALHSVAIKQGVVAIVWDEVMRAMAEGSIAPEKQPSKAVKLQWALAAEQVERKYLRQVQVIEKLARFFAEHNIKMMILKGYGLSLNYPVPNHRPCSDVDIWLFEEQQKPDGSITKCSAQQRADNLYKTDGMTQIKRAEENPVLGELYARYIGDRAHELLHVHYHPKHED